MSLTGNTFGQALRLTSWGESHGPAIGGVVDGIPPGLPLSIEDLQEALNRRRPGHSAYTSPRQEPDTVEILSGVFEGRTLGTPLSFMIRNTNVQSEDYEAFRHALRPGHADFTYQKKYGIRDHRGGGRASARETAVRVAGGAIALKILHHLFAKDSLTIRGALIQIADKPINRDHWNWQEVSQNPFFCPDSSAVPIWEKLLDNYRTESRSAGALIEVSAHGVPAGLGEPVYDRLDADLAKALMSINAVKGVEIGQGFGCIAALHGYDEITPEGFLSNNAGGILGGISTGQDIVCRLAVKPTSSTPAPRKTITEDQQATTIAVTGRHDPCVGIRAVPVAEAMVALVLADHALRWRGQCGPLTGF